MDDNEFFTKYILSEPKDKERKIDAPKDSHKRIKRAAELAKEHVEKIVSVHKDSAKVRQLIDWVDYIKNHVEVILLKVPDHLNAFRMFETLNDRGLIASQADLLKNHLLSLISHFRLSEAQHKWSQMIGTLESQEHEDSTVVFLRNMLISMHGPTKERDVYEKIKHSVNSEAKAIEFLDNLADSAIDYIALLNPLHSKWNEYGHATRGHLKTLLELKVEQIRPLLFSVAKHFSVAEARKAFRLFVCWSVRILLAGGRGGLWDRAYALAAQKVGKQDITSAKEILRNLNRTFLMMPHSRLLLQMRL